MKRPLNIRLADTIRPCSVCRQPSSFAAERGRPIHPSCGYGFELFHPEADDRVDEGIELCLDVLGGRVVVVALMWDTL